MLERAILEMVEEIDLLAKTKCFLIRLKTLSFLISVLAVCYSQANYNATVLLFLNTSCDEHFHDEIEHMLRQDIFPRKSEAINLRWLKANVTGIDRSQAGVLEALLLMENHSRTVEGAIFFDITRERLALSSLLEDSNVVTVGLFQDQEVLRTQVNIMDISGALGFPHFGKCFC